MKRLIILIIFLIMVGGGFVLYYQAGTLPVDKNSQENKIFVIQKGEDSNSIVNNLYDQGLIRNKIVFFIVIKQLGLEKNIQAGDFRLNPSMSALEIAKFLTKGTLDTWLTLIEGTRKEEIAQIISQNLGIPETEFLKYADEGYLFPDTYLIPKNATATAVIEILKTNFNSRFSEDLRKKARQKNLTVNEVMTLASLVEREARFAEDRLRVANVLFRRLENGMKLDIDATVQYAIGYQSEEKSWWKKELSLDDLAVDSPYNTYTNAGLPPGPIANPGLASIQAVISADSDTPYLFYVSDSSGHLHFARSLEEHNENVKKYIR